MNLAALARESKHFRRPLFSSRTQQFHCWESFIKWITQQWQVTGPQPPKSDTVQHLYSHHHQKQALCLRQSSERRPKETILGIASIDRWLCAMPFKSLSPFLFILWIRKNRNNIYRNRRQHLKTWLIIIMLIAHQWVDKIIKAWGIYDRGKILF